MAQINDTMVHDKLVRFEGKFANFNSKVLGNSDYTPVIEDEYDNFSKAKDIVMEHVATYSRKLSNYFGKMSDKEAKNIINFNDRVNNAMDYETLTNLVDEFDHIVSRVWAII